MDVVCVYLFSDFGPWVQLHLFDFANLASDIVGSTSSKKKRAAHILNHVQFMEHTVAIIRHSDYIKVHIWIFELPDVLWFFPLAPFFLNNLILQIILRIGHKRRRLRLLQGNYKISTDDWPGFHLYLYQLFGYWVLHLLACLSWDWKPECCVNFIRKGNRKRCD